MLAVARTLRRSLARCGPKASGAQASTRSSASASSRPAVVGGRGVSGTAFLADPAYRRYLFEQLGAQSVDMETAAVAQWRVRMAFPSSPFAASATSPVPRPFNADVGALFASGLAERNASAVTLAFLAAWAERERGGGVHR